MTDATGTRPNKVLLVIKPTAVDSMDSFEFDEHRKLLATGDTDAEIIQRAHEEHQATLPKIHAALADRKIDYAEFKRKDWAGWLPDGTNLVIAVGGDGTFLFAAQHIESRIPILGVNSAPSSSYGHFCMADGDTIGSTLDAIISGATQPIALPRLIGYLSVNGGPETRTNPILNEILIADQSPEVAARYYLQIDGKETEVQVSSGLMIGPAPGSTGWMHSSGAQVQSITDRQFQYIVRDRFSRPGQRLIYQYGLLPETTELVVVSRMRNGCLFVDTEKCVVQFPRRARLRVFASRIYDLFAYIDPHVNDVY